MKKFTTKVGALALGSVFAVSAMAAPMASAATIAEMQADIQAMIATLSAQLAALSTSETTSSATTTTNMYTHVNTLRVGSRGTQVAELQTCLNRLGNNTGVADGVFGPNTAAGVMSFQGDNGLVVDGVIGQMTGPKFETACAVTEVTTGTTVTTDASGTTTTTTTTSVSGDKIVVSGMAENDMTIGNAQTVVFTKLTLTAGDKDVMVKDLMIEFVGSANRSMVEKVILLDSAMVELDNDTIDSDDEAKVEVDMEIKDGESLTLYIAAKTAANVVTNNGLDVSFTVTSVMTDGADVEGTPVEGAVHELNSAFSVDTFDAVISQDETGSVKIGEEGVKVATVNVENNSSDDSVQTVKAIKLELTGTGNEDSIDNVVIVVDGKTYEGAEKDEEYTFDFGNGIELEEDGDDEDFVIFADVADDAAKTFGFDVLSVVVTDEDGSLLSDGTATYTYAATLEIDVSEVTISKTTDVQSEKVAAGANSVELASFDVEVTGKDVEGDVEVTIVVSAVDIEAADGVAGTVEIKDVDLDNLAIYMANGDRLSDKEDTAFSITPIDGTADQATYVLTLDNVTFEEGQDAEDYVIKADVNSDAPTNTKYEITQIKYVSIEDEDGEDISDVTETIATPAEIEVEAATIAVSVEDADEQDVNSDNDNVVIAEIKLDADNSGDDVNVSQIKLAYTLGGLVPQVGTITFAGTESDTANEILTTTITDAGGTSTFITTVLADDVATDAATDVSVVTNVDSTATYTVAEAAGVVTINSNTNIVFAATTVNTTPGATVDITAGSLVITTEASTADIDDVKSCRLFNGSDPVSDAEDAAATVTYNVDVDVTKDTEVNLTVQCDLGADFNNGNTIIVTGTNFDAKGVETNLDLDAAVADATTATITDGSTELGLSSDDANDAKVVKDDADDVVLGNYDFKAKDSALVIDDVTVTFDATVAAEFDGKVGIYVNGVEEDSVTPTDSATFTNLSIDVAKDETVVIEFRANMDLAGAANIESVAMTTEEGVAVATENLDGPVVEIVAAMPIVTAINVDTSSLDAGYNNVLFAFEVKAEGGAITMGDVTFEVATVDANLTDITVEVHSSNDPTGSSELDVAAVNIAAGTSVDVNADLSTVVISENDTYYVFLIADNTAGDDADVRVTVSDAAYSVTGGFDMGGIDGDKLIEGDMKSLLTK